MANSVVVVGAQWGDEGKGKIVDWLSHRADVVVRFQGGHNAGHTLVVGDKTYKLALLPSGLVQGKTSVIGNGVVVDPWALLDEIARVSAMGVAISPGRGALFHSIRVSGVFWRTTYIRTEPRWLNHSPLIWSVMQISSRVVPSTHRL